jgi:hypothetical protein
MRKGRGYRNLSTQFLKPPYDFVVALCKRRDNSSLNFFLHLYRLGGIPLKMKSLRAVQIDQEVSIIISMKKGSLREIFRLSIKL